MGHLMKVLISQQAKKGERSSVTYLVHVPLSLGTVIFTLLSPIPFRKSISTYPTDSLDKRTLSSWQISLDSVKLVKGGLRT